MQLQKPPHKDLHLMKILQEFQKQHCKAINHQMPLVPKVCRDVQVEPLGGEKQKVFVKRNASSGNNELSTSALLGLRVRHEGGKRYGSFVK